MKRGRSEITVEVKLFKREQLLNLLINNNIAIKNSITMDSFTIRFEIEYRDYKKVKKLVKRLKGKIKVVSTGSLISIIIRLKNNVGVIVGLILSFCILFALSNFVWRIKIESKSYLPAYEVRAALRKMGIKPGMSKTAVDVYSIEKTMEKELEEIMWINARVEGSTLKIKFEEKILTSVKAKNEDLKGSSKVATMDGEVKRVYTTAGTAKVKEGDIVKKGDALISGEQGDGEIVKEKVVPEGVVLANTFYERNLELQVSGKREIYSKNTEEEIYMTFYGKKIYLKKPTKEFGNYDKIEEKGKFLNKNIYYEKVEEEIKESRENIIQDAVSKLEKAVAKEVSRDAVIIDKVITEEDLDNGKMNLKVLFVVEQNIVSA